MPAASSRRRRRRCAASARRRRGRAARRPVGAAPTASSRSTSATAASTRAPQSGHAETVAASRSPSERRAARPSSVASSATAAPSSSTKLQRPGHAGHGIRCAPLALPPDASGHGRERCARASPSRPCPNRRADEVVVRVHGAGPEPGRPPAAGRPLPRAAGCPGRHPRPRVRRRRRGAPVPPSTIAAPAIACSASSAAAPKPSTCRVPAAHCAPIPDGLDLVEMGGVPEAFVTAHDALVTRAPGRAGEWVLVHAVGSGVGTAGCSSPGARRACRRHRAHAGQARTLPRARPRRRRSCRRRRDGELDVDALVAAIVEATGRRVDVIARPRRRPLRRGRHRAPPRRRAGSC